MHRMKIGLVAAALLLAATAAFYVAVTSDLKAAATHSAETKVARAQRLYQQISRLGGMDFANLAADRARRPTVVSIFEKTDETARRQAAFEECEVLNAGLQQESRKADIVAVIDSSGKVLARDLNPNAMFGEDLRSKNPAVDRALKGSPVKDVWSLANRVTEVAIAPIAKPDGTIVGGLLLGYVLSAKTAQETRDLLGTEVGFFHDGRVHTSSFVNAGDSTKEDVNRTQALNAFLGASRAAEAVKSGKPTEPVQHSMEGTEYAVVAAPLPGNFADKTSGVVLLSSIDEGMDRAKDAGRKVLLFGVLAIVIALGASVMTAKRFIKPLDSIELGVADVINGNIDYTFKPVGPDFEGLSNSLNVMLARLLGRDEPNDEAVDDEENDRRWKAEQMIIEEGDGTPAPGTAPSAQESDAAYYPRLYNEYVTALRAAGKPAEGVSVQAFMAKLRLAEAGLRQKWSCRLVRFQILKRDNDVVFRAVRLG